MPEPRGSNINWSQLSLVAVAGVAAISILVLLGMIIWMSLRTGVPGQPSDYSLKNYVTILADPYTYKVMWTTLYFSAVTIAVAVPLGFIFAWLVERTDMPYKALAMSLLSIGILFPTFLKAMGWVFLLHPRIGVINIFLMQLFGLSAAPLNIATLTGIGWFCSKYFCLWILNHSLPGLVQSKLWSTAEGLHFLPSDLQAVGIQPAVRRSALCEWPF